MNLLNLEYRRVVHESVFAHKDLNGNLPKIFKKGLKNSCPKCQQGKVNIKNLIYLNTTFQNLKNRPFIEKIKAHKTGYQKYLLNENMI